MNDELERIWKEAVVAHLRYYPGICLMGLRKTMKTLSYDSLSSGRDLNPTPPEYEAGVQNNQQRHLVARMEEIRNAYKILQESQREENLIVDGRIILKRIVKIICENLDSIRLAHDNDRWRALMNS
jgi:hypothetical protein